MPRFPAFTWDVQVRRYRDSGGRLVAQTSVRAALDLALADQSRIARTLSESHRAGRISLNEWALGMREVVKNTQLFSAAAARGGWGQLDAGDFGRVGQTVRSQYDRLAQFTAELEAGAPRDGNFQRRAQMYAQAGRTIFHEVDRQVQAEVGHTEERSVLHPADHCVQCLEEAAAGFRPIGVMIPIGERECLTNCQCTVEFRGAA